MSDKTKARTQYKYIVLNADTGAQEEERINAAAAEGYTIEHVIQALRIKKRDYLFPVVIMSKDCPQ